MPDYSTFLIYSISYILQNKRKGYHERLGRERREGEAIRTSGDKSLEGKSSHSSMKQNILCDSPKQHSLNIQFKSNHVNSHIVNNNSLD